MAFPPPKKGQKTTGVAGFTSSRSMGGAKSHEFFPLKTGFTRGYRNREDNTMLPPDTLVKGSQNVLTDTFERVGIRKGYTLDGAANSDLAPIASAFDWQRHTGDIRNMRSGFNTSGSNGKLQFRYKANAGDIWNNVTLTAGEVVWMDILTGQTNVGFNYASFWDSVDLISLLLMVNGTSNIYSWSGGIASLESATNATGGIRTVSIIAGGTGFQVGDTLDMTTAAGVITSIDSTPTSGGAGYTGGDTLTVTDLGFRSSIAATTVLAGVVQVVTLLAGGDSYAPGPGQNTSVTPPGGIGCTINVLATTDYTGTNGQLRVTSVSGGGIITGLEVVNPGFGYTALPDSNYQHSTSGAGINASIAITSTTTNGVIKISGTKTFAQLGFDPNQTGIIINGTSYNVDSVQNWDSFYLTGIDASAEPPSSVIVQAVMITPNSSMSGIPATFPNALIGVLYNQVYIGALDNSSIYLSNQSSYTDYTFSTPREPGEGAIITLDAPPTAFVPQENSMYISAGLSFWYLVAFQLSADLTNESISIQRISTVELQSAQSQAWVGKMKNQIVFTSFEPIMNSFGPKENILNSNNQPQMVDLSFPIVNDMNGYDFTDGAIIYFRQFIYFSIPKSGIVRVYNMTNPENPYWEAPLILPIARFAIIENALYGHSYLVGETYKLFDGWTDNGNAVEAIAKFAFDSDGVRSDTKSFNRFWVEGYIGTDTTLNLGFQYDLDGCAINTTFPIHGSDTSIVCSVPIDNSLGKAPLGKNPLGGALVIDDALPPYFHVIKTFNAVPYFYQQTYFRSEGIGNQWYLLSFGGAAKPTSEESTSITQ